jgi:hypothetical protein
LGAALRGRDFRVTPKESIGDLLARAEVHRRISARWPGILELRTEVERKISGFAGLSPFRKKILMVALYRAKRRVEIGKDASTTEREAARLIREHANSIKRLIRLGKQLLPFDDEKHSPTEKKAGELLMRSARKWAYEISRVSSDKRPPAGFLEKWEYFEYGAHPFLESFFVACDVMGQIVDTIEPGPALKLERSPEQRLNAAVLPKIYSRVFGKKFTATAKTETAQTSPGIKFIHEARCVLGLVIISDEAVRAAIKAHGA